MQISTDALWIVEHPCAIAIDPEPEKQLLESLLTIDDQDVVSRKYRYSLAETFRHKQAKFQQLELDNYFESAVRVPQNLSSAMLY